MDTVDRVAAEQLALLPAGMAAPARRRPSGHRAQRQGLSFREWVRREAQLHRALEDARETGDPAKVERAYRDWHAYLNLNPVRGRGRRAGWTR